MDAQQETERLLRESGAILLRQKRHKVWSLGAKGIFTQSRTPNSSGAQNDLMVLKRLLGMTNGHGPGERREKRNGKGRAEERPRFANNQLADQLYIASLEERIEALESEIEATLWFEREQSRQTSEELMDALAEIERLHSSRCWWCKLKNRIRRKRWAG